MFLSSLSHTSRSIVLSLSHSTKSHMEGGPVNVTGPKPPKELRDDAVLQPDDAFVLDSQLRSFPGERLTLLLDRRRREKRLFVIALRERVLLHGKLLVRRADANPAIVWIRRPA